VDAPRTHHQWLPDVLVLEGRSWARATQEALTSMGHKLGTNVRQGNANSIVVDPDGKLEGIADHRRSTSKASGD
jgi:gamma-glutamyltranspeptidase/glutathione hydrolase